MEESNVHISPILKVRKRLISGLAGSQNFISTVQEQTVRSCHQVSERLRMSVKPLRLKDRIAPAPRHRRRSLENISNPAVYHALVGRYLETTEGNLDPVHRDHHCRRNHSHRRY